MPPIRPGSIPWQSAFHLSLELTSLFGSIAPEEGGGGTFEAEVPHSEVEYYASRPLSVGTDIFVDSPPELVEAIQNKAREVIRLYE